MKLELNMPISDDELVKHLESRNTLSFVGGGVDWHKIERQVERLGFGDLYIVSTARARNMNTSTVSARPTAA
jgi:hypothetical protein